MTLFNKVDDLYFYIVQVIGNSIYKIPFMTVEIMIQKKFFSEFIFLVLCIQCMHACETKRRLKPKPIAKVVHDKRIAINASTR